jgi:hypothetical protein
MHQQRKISLKKLQIIMRKMYNELNHLLVNFQYVYEAFFHGLR